MKWYGTSLIVPVMTTGLAYIYGAWISIHMPTWLWGEIIYSFLNFNGSTIEVWRSNFIAHFTVDVITYPDWN